MAGHHDIFISYAHADRAVAARYAAALQRNGFDVWWDDAIRSGETFDEVIEAALRAARAVVVLWSPRSVVSRWVRAEATIADRRGTLRPVQIEPCERPIIFELIHTPDHSHWRGAPDDRAWLAFVDELRRFVANDRVPDDDSANGAVTGQAPVPLRPAEPRGRSARPTIGVLRCVDMASSRSNGDFIDSLQDEIVAHLSRNPALAVVSMTNPDTAPRDGARAGDMPGVRYAIDGSVRAAGGQLRVNVKLVNPASGEHLWTARFDGAEDDALDLQDRIAGAVAAAVEPTLLAAEIARARAMPPEARSALDLTFVAQSLVLNWDRASIAEALALLDEALRRDPGLALANAIASWCHAVNYQSGWSDDPEKTRRIGRELGRQAVNAAEHDSNVLMNYAVAQLTWGDDLAGTEALIDRALGRNPANSTLLSMRAWLLLSQGGRHAQAQALFSDAIALDANATGLAFNLFGQASCLLLLRRVDEAIRLLREVVQRRPDYPAPQMALVAALAQSGQPDAARKAASAIAPGTQFGPILEVFRDRDDRTFLIEGLMAAGLHA